MALIGDGTIGSGTIASPQDAGVPANLVVSSSLKTIDIGDVVELTAIFSDPKTGKAVTPDSVGLTVLLPSSETVAPEVESEEDGSYRALFEPEEAGKYRFAFDGVGEHQASEENVFWVRKRQVPRG